MPSRNRVTPFSEIVETPERGTVMGNRGLLHNDRKQIVRQWQVKRWIVCLLEFKGRRRPVMAPGQYTELFFLDEATALAAGHRPCAECRRARFQEFRTAWAAGVQDSLPAAEIRAPMIDARLHNERVGTGKTNRTYHERLDRLPTGVFVELPDQKGVAHLVKGSQLLRWSLGGYSERMPRPGGLAVTVLTPESTVKTIQAGYEPDLHPTAREP